MLVLMFKPNVALIALQDFFETLKKIHYAK